MSALVIDDSGAVWPAHPEILARRFGLQSPRDFTLRAVDLGFIFVRFGEGGACIALRPQFASRSAVSRLLGVIGQRNPARVALSHDSRMSSWEIIIGAGPAIARIEQLVAETRNPTPRPLFIAKPLPLERCLDIAGGQLLEVLQAWQQSSGQWQADFQGRLQRSGLLPGTVIVGQPRGSERLLIEHWGAHVPSVKDWTRIAPGRDLEDHPNVEVGRRLAAMGRQRIAERIPQLFASDIVYRGLDGDLVRFTCNQLGLPWRTSDGAAIVTSITAQRRTLVLERPNRANRFVQQRPQNQAVDPIRSPLIGVQVVSARKTLRTLDAVGISEFLIDDTGVVGPVESDTIARRFGGLRMRQNVVLQAIACGFIFARFRDSGARIALRPQFASPSALSRLFSLIHQRKLARVELACDARLSSWEIIIGADRAIAQITQLVDDARNALPRPLLTAERLPLEHCLDIAGGQLIPILQAWEQRQGRWEPDLYARLLEWKLLPATVISRQLRASERLVFHHWGAHVTLYGQDWTRIAPGRDVEDQPNIKVGRWRAALLRQTIAENLPRLTVQDLVLRRINGELARVQYHQLALPWQESDGTVLLTGIRVAGRTLILERPNLPNRLVQQNARKKAVTPIRSSPVTVRVVSLRKTLRTLDAVEMSELLIDDTGVISPVEPHTISRRFSDLRLRRDFVAQAVSLGFVFVRFSHSDARVALRPELPSRFAVSRLFDILRRRNPAGIALARDARLSAWELIIGAERAIARIGQLVAEARSPSPRPLLTAQRLPLERCLDIAGGQLFPVLQAWQQRQGRWEADLYGCLHEGGLSAGTMIARQARGSERLLIEHWGAKLTTYGKNWIRVAPGRDVEDQPNTEIARWDGARQRQILAESVPWFTASDFVFRAIDDRLVRLRHYRLALPWRRSGGEAILTAITTQRRMLVLDRPNPAN